MTSIIRRLYSSERYPNEIFDSSQAYRNVTQLFAHEKDAFLNDLIPRQIEEFEKLMNENAAVTPYESTDAFRADLRHVRKNSNGRGIPARLNFLFPAFEGFHS